MKRNVLAVCSWGINAIVVCSYWNRSDSSQCSVWAKQKIK